ncbi:MAG: segregation/condensation protein A [Candidatus Melainabacteria bacterium]
MQPQAEQPTPAFVPVSVRPPARAARPAGGELSPEQEKEELNGIELLVHLAKNGEIDPWNVDIVKVADEYLKAVSELKAHDLKITGKTLLYLAVLLRMKSDSLAGINYLNPPEDDPFDDDCFDPDFMDGGRAVQPKLAIRSLDEALERRTSTKQKRIRTVTLNDLIRELKRYEELEKRRSLKEKVEKIHRRRMTDYSEFTADDIEEMAHEEFIEDTIMSLTNILERILIKKEAVGLSELQAEGRIDRISAFLALLFLASRGEVALEQEEFYAEVYIRKDEPPVMGGLSDDENTDEDTREDAQPAGLAS